jgi:hypothetical protein
MQTIAFADEFGTNSFAFDTQGSHFIVCSIIVDKKELASIESEVDVIRKRYFQTGEIKSSGVGPKHQRRILILEKLCQLNFQIYAVVVDKRQLESEGFKYKSSFYKFVNGLVYKELYKTFPNLTLVVDEFGANDFMLSFKKYVQKNHIRDLFQGSDFVQENSQGNIMIQVADFFAGTLGYCFDELKKGDYSEEFLKIIEPRLSSINHFPQSYETLKQELNNADKQFDGRIATIGLRTALDFLDTKKVVDQADADQLSFVKLLLLYSRTYSKKGFVSTRELLNHLDYGRKAPISEQYFRTKIVGKVRDFGVLVASNSSGERKGYMLPESADDLYKFINHSNSVVVPMIKRIKKARDIIKLATNNELDLLAKPEYERLQKIISDL